MSGAENLTKTIFSGKSKEMIRAMKFTGVRVERYEELKAVRHELGKTEYAKAVRELNRRERVALKASEKRRVDREKKEAEAHKEWLRQEAIREAEREKKREEARIRRNEARKAKRLLKKEQKSVIVNLHTKPPQNEDEYLNIITEIFNKLNNTKNKEIVYYQFAVNGEIIQQGILALIGGDGEARYWNSLARLLRIGPDSDADSLFTHNLDGSERDETDNIVFTILRSEDIPPMNIQQKYRDGIKHCVLEPLYDLWTKMAENSESEASKKRCRQVANKIKYMAEKVYPDGVPAGLDMEVVAKVCHRCIVVYDMADNEIARYNMKSPKMFNFTNVRYNHLEAGRIVWDSVYERVSQERMAELIYEHDRDGIFPVCGVQLHMESDKEYIKDNCYSLRSSRGAWAVFNEDYDIFQEFNKSTGINNYGLNAVKYPALNEFVLDSRLINSAPTPLCDEPDNVEGVKHIDIEKAYTQHSKCSYYRGFLGHITDYGRLNVGPEFLRDHVGIFMFRVIENTNAVLEQLGIYANNRYTLPSPEIQFMVSLGMKIEILGGCWGSTFDIEYTPEMMENRRYCIWAGKLGMESDSQTYTFKGDATWASCLKEMIGEENVYYFANCDMIMVRRPKKSYNTRHHILSFITSYTRINMLETMMKIVESGGELTKVILDGIYFRGELPDIEVPYKFKEVKIHKGFRDAWYYASEFDVERFDNYNMKFDIPDGKKKNVIVLTGSGGTGKSHSVLRSTNVVKPLYVVPTHLLGRKMRTAVGCEYTTIHKLIGTKNDGKEEVKCRCYKEEFNEPGVVFIDELTMIEKSWIDRAIEMYPNTKFYIAGDVDTKQWYQCRNGHPGAFSEIWIPSSEYYILDYTTDYRSLDDGLKAMKIAIRDEMRRVFSDGGQTDALRMNAFMKKYVVANGLCAMSMDDAMKSFVKGNIWIAGTHKTNKKLLDNSVVSGYINRDKEIVAEENDKAEKRGSFTTHSFQGMTLESEKVFISLDFFEYAMLYTSVSRVRRLSQLVFVI